MSTQDIPEGTVTVLFTDLVESTQLNQALGDDGARQIGRQVDELARHAVESYIEVVTEDDAGLPVSWAAHRFQDVVNAAVDV